MSSVMMQPATRARHELETVSRMGSVSRPCSFVFYFDKNDAERKESNLYEMSPHLT